MSYWVTIKTMWACDMGFHSSLRPHVTWDWVTVWAKLGIGVLLVMNTTSSLTFNRPTMDFLLYTLFHGNPTPSNGRPGCPAFSATKNGLVISFSVNFKSGWTANSAKQELVENPALHEGAEFIIVAFGGNDLCPGKIPSDDLILPEEVSNRLWDLKQNCRRMPTEWMYVHWYPGLNTTNSISICDTTNSKIRQLFGGKERRDNVLDLAGFIK